MNFTLSEKTIQTHDARLSNFVTEVYISSVRTANNKLKRVTPNMKLGVNSDVNSDGTVSVGIKHNFGESKVKLPHAIQHVLRKAVEKVENLSSNKKDPETFEKDTPKSTHKKHELDLILIMIAAMTGAWLLFR